MQLFTLNSKGTILFNPDIMNLCPEFSVLTDEDKLALVLAYDYESPFHQLPESDRRMKACFRAYGKPSQKFDTQVMKNAVERYMSLQYSPKLELMKVYEIKLAMLSGELVNAVTTRAIKEILDSQDLIKKSIRNLQQDIYEDKEAESVLKGGGKNYYIEKVMGNMEEYERIKNNKPATAQ